MIPLPFSRCYPSEEREDNVSETCTCGPGAWGTCDQCGAEAWVKHHCPFPCDDVTCEDGSLCIGCLTGRPCPMHNGAWDDDWDDPTTSPTRDILAALLRSRGYIHDDAADPDDMHWVGPQLGIRALLQCVAYEMGRDVPGGKTPGWNRYEVAVAARCYPSEVTR